MNGTDAAMLLAAAVIAACLLVAFWDEIRASYRCWLEDR